jgi:membrane-bound acyltransferase YfiQ involved in biofilm formation
MKMTGAATTTDTSYVQQIIYNRYLPQFFVYNDIIVTIIMFAYRLFIQETSYVGE